MIGPSQRRSAVKPVADPLSLHQRLSRRRYWYWRLHVCTATALVASIAGWLLGLSIGAHLVAVAAGFALGFAWPIRSVAPWALGWIESKAGYSYRTAIELSSPGANDPYGFAEAVRARAASRAARLELEPPSMQPWWLPALVLAFALVLLPALGFGGGGLFGGQAPPAAPSPPSAPPAATQDEDARAADEEADDEPARGDDDELNEGALADGEAEPEQPDQPEVEVEADPADQPDDADMDDREALSRFLDDLRERQESRDDDVAELREAERAAHEAERAAEQEAVLREAEEGAEGDGDDLEAEVLERGEGEEEGGEAGTERADDEGIAEDAEGDVTRQEATDPAADGEEEAALGDENGENGLDEAEDGVTQAADDMAAQDDETAAGEEAGSEAEAPAPGDDEPGAADVPFAEGEDEAGDAAGSMPSPPEPAGGIDPEDLDRRAVEHLPGQIGDGPSAVDGEVRLPGMGDADGPEGEGREQFDRAVERAVTEGRIPVEYQEILREYFR